MHNETIKLEERYSRLSTYGTKLAYKIEISDKENDGLIYFDGQEINTGNIEVIPKIGGIEKVYAIHYYQNNVKAIQQVELYREGLVEDLDAQNGCYHLSNYTIDMIGKKSEVSYGTLYLVVEDYQHNYFLNMIVYEINKKDGKLKTRVYSDIDLLHLQNEDICVLPEFDIEQLKEFENLKDKLDEML